MCTSCASSVVKLSGDLCRFCSRKSKEPICYDCQRWKAYYSGDDPLQKSYSIFQYNHAMQDLITQWKYRGDYVLGYVFQSVVTAFYKKHIEPLHKKIVVVPIPLSEERLYHRGFNQANMLAQFIDSEKADVFQRIYSEKQAKKSRRERIQMKNPFILKKSLHIPVLLVDDIYTTGRTLRHAAQLLKEAGCPAIYALTICRS